MTPLYGVNATILEATPIQFGHGTYIAYAAHPLHFDHINSNDGAGWLTPPVPLDPERCHFATCTSYCTKHKSSTAAVSPSADLLKWLTTRTITSRTRSVHVVELQHFAA